jgi:ribosomal protein L14
MRGIVDNGAAKKVTCILVDFVVGDGIAHTHPSDDFPQTREKVKRIINPEYYRKIAGKKQGVHRVIKDQETTVARTDKITLDDFAGILLKNKWMMLKAKFNGSVKHLLHQKRNKRLLELPVRAVLKNVNAKNRFVRYFPDIHIFFEILIQIAFIGDNIGFGENHSLIVLVEYASDNIVFKFFDRTCHY